VRRRSLPRSTRPRDVACQVRKISASNKSDIAPLTLLPLQKPPRGASAARICGVEMYVKLVSAMSSQILIRLIRFISAVALVLISATFASLAAQTSSGVITACVGKGSDLARFVTADQPCRLNETRIVFNVEGRPGPQGPAGPQGPPGPAGPSGTSGQSASTVFGTGPLTNLFTTMCTPIPGLTMTVDVPADSVLAVSTDGGVQTTSPSTTGWSQVEIQLQYDGASGLPGTRRQITPTNNGGVGATLETWSITQTTTLSPAPHTISVCGRLVAGFPVNISGSNTSALQGQLSVIVLKK
jgi:hypothetical protein